MTSCDVNEFFGNKRRLAGVGRRLRWHAVHRFIVGLVSSNCILNTEILLSRFERLVAETILDCSQAHVVLLPESRTRLTKAVQVVSVALTVGSRASVLDNLLASP